jgi:CTP:molybdopterin cytidylyltransferase MocA
MRDLLAAAPFELIVPPSAAYAGVFVDVDTPEDLDRVSALRPDPPIPKQAAR